MMKKTLPILLAPFIVFALEVPLQSKSHWEILNYSKIPNNTVSFSQKGMRIQVKGSASPIIHPIKPAMKASRLEVMGKIEGKINLGKNIQGSKKADDFVFRLGLVYEGTQKLTGTKSWFAPAWVKKLFSLAPKNVGIDKIVFYNVVSQKGLLGKKRTHPSSKLIEEHFTSLVEKDGSFTLKANLPGTKKIHALWLSSDGDQTQSKFNVDVHALHLH